MSKFWSDKLLSLEPYKAGEQPKDQKYVKLNTNENPYPPSPKAVEAIKHLDTDLLRLYPDPESTKLKEAIADFYDLKNSKVFIANGSDELLALVYLAFFKQKYPILFPNISYSFYPVYCDLFDIDATLEPLNENFEIELENYTTENGGIIFANPNAPTGKFIEVDRIEALLKRNTESVVVVDEAYVDFGGESCIPLTEKYPNLLVVHTFSKSRSMAGIRAGYAIGSDELVEGLIMVKNSFNSYPLDKVALETCTASMKDRAYFDETCAKVIKTREWTAVELEKIGFTVIPSVANFLFVKPTGFSAEEWYQNLKKTGVLIRYFGNKPIVGEYCRVTIGTDEEMQIFIDKTKELLS